MKAHPEAVPPYIPFKRALAAAAPDADWYSDLKKPVVDLIAEIAEAWSRRSGWTASSAHPASRCPTTPPIFCAPPAGTWRPCTMSPLDHPARPAMHGVGVTV
jgi:hypothetical protein